MLKTLWALLGLGLLAYRPGQAAPALAPAAAGAAAASPAWYGEQEVFYLIFVRSFADSDGDRIGDFKGIEQRLPYLQSLGVTSILLTPVVPSRFYHNYFASRFDGVDAAYGDRRSFRHLVRAVHARHMRIVLDEEIQYVAEEHPWWLQSAGHPESPYSPYILYNGPGNTQPESGFLDSLSVSTYDGQTVRLAMVNLAAPVVRQYFDALFIWWLRQGVDGFRIDHMMDDLDNKGRLTNLVAGFWAPLFAHARAFKPGIAIIAEQADWKYGDDLLVRGDVDLVYAFPLRDAIASLDRNTVAAAISSTQAKTPAGKGQLIFIENHDTNRFASAVGGDPAKERLGAALGVLLKGTPLIYYGQELGMKGRRIREGLSDGNDIPDREAFRWTPAVTGPGSATWYNGAASWWTDRYARDDDGISLQEERRDPVSLLSFYRRVLALRHSRVELRRGDQQIVATDQPSVLAVRRARGRCESLLLVNFSAQAVEARLPADAFRFVHEGGVLRDLLSGTGRAELVGGSESVSMAPFGVRLLAKR